MLKLDRSRMSLERIPQLTLADADLLERKDLQRAIVGSWDAFREELGMPELMLLGEEIEPHQSCRDRIDLLALDPEGSPVVIELKRGSERLQLLQAIAYAGMLSRWSKDEFRARVPLAACVQKEDVERYLAADEFVFKPPRIVLIAESFDPEVILAANWLGDFDVPITAFAVVVTGRNDDVLLSISQRFPLPELEDIYRARGRRKRTEVEDSAEWDAVLGESLPEVCRRAIEVLRTLKPGDPLRRRFVSMYSDGQFGGLQLNIAKKHVKVYVWDQSPEMRQRLDDAMGEGFGIMPWGNEQTANSGFTFVLKQPEEFERFVEAARRRG